MSVQPIYLDCAATTQVDQRVAEVAISAMVEDFGNAGSRTHQFGSQAKQLVEVARSELAKTLQCDATEVIFTSGATEANNLAILGLLQHGQTTGKRHIISSPMEHKAVLEPLDVAISQGFEVSMVSVDARGRVDPAEVSSLLRDDTLLISLMQVNNETGIIQPINEISDLLANSQTYLHVDGAQGFTKDDALIGNQRVDLYSISGHKIGGPKGIGALITRMRSGTRPPLTPLMVGGGQERGLRPGTLPVPMISALGKAAELGRIEFSTRRRLNLGFRSKLIAAFEPLNPSYLGTQEHCIPNIINFALRGVDSEAFMLATKDLIAISNGSACTSHRYEPSHVLTAMNVENDLRRGAVRLSWSASTAEPDWSTLVARLKQLV